MTDTVYMRGGFGTDYPGMSDSLRARVAAADAEFDRVDAAAEHERAERLARNEETRVRASIELAYQRGDHVDVLEAYRAGGVGRTPQEAIEYASALADIDDMKMEAIRRKAEREFNERYFAGAAADMSAPTAEDIALKARAEAGNAKWHERREAEKAKIEERATIVRMAREGAAWDRARDVR